MSGCGMQRLTGLNRGTVCGLARHHDVASHPPRPGGGQ